MVRIILVNVRTSDSLVGLAPGKRWLPELQNDNTQPYHRHPSAAMGRRTFVGIPHLTV